MSRCHHREEASDACRLTLSLEAEPLFAVGVLRAWVAERRGGQAGVPPWRAVLAMAEMPEEVAAVFDGFLSQVAHGMRRALDVRCGRCPRVGRDEEAFLRILEALQRGDRLAAIGDIADWVVGPSVPSALEAGLRLSRLLGMHGVMLEGAARPRSPALRAEPKDGPPAMVH